MSKTEDYPTSRFDYFWWTSKTPPADTKTSFEGRLVFIIGANADLGVEAATKFVCLSVSIAVRSLEKGEAAKLDIERKTKCNADVIQLFKPDMSNYESIENFVKEPLEITAKIGTPSHLEFVSSHGHKAAQVETIKGGDSILEKFNDLKLFSFIFQYVNSKLLDMWVMKQNTSRVSLSKGIINTSHPGLCQGSLRRDLSISLWIPDGRSADEGSRTLVSAVAVGKEARGELRTNDEITAEALVTAKEGKDLSDQFWRDTLEILVKQNPEVTSILADQH